jgi:ornithine cyclodeaminase/alanine dehydrogenase-like protein (mu-crystallin family)
MAMSRQPLVILDAAEVEAAMPPIPEQLDLARRTMIALIADADLPPKIAVHPRPADSFAHAMPAYLHGPRDDGSADLLGIKWVLGFPPNRAAGLPAIVATVMLNDPRTGLPLAILDGTPITARRTAAVSGAAIQAWGPATGLSGHAPRSRAVRVAMIGAGAQARSHLAVLAEVLPGAQLSIADRHADRAETVAQEARDRAAFAAVRVTTDPLVALEGADVALAMTSFGPDRQSIPVEAFAPESLVVAVDYDMCVPAALARDAGLFLVDERGQFESNIAAGLFAGYPPAHQTMGEALRDRTVRPEHGRTLVTHLGVGLADVIFADAILRRREAAAGT